MGDDDGVDDNDGGGSGDGDGDCGVMVVKMMVVIMMGRCCLPVFVKKHKRSSASVGSSRIATRLQLDPEQT